MIALLLAAAAAGVAYEYRVEAGEGARVLAVEARFSDVPAGCFEVGRGAEAFVADARVRRGRRWRSLERINRCFDTAGGRDLRVRYRFDLARAATLRDRRLHEDRGALFAAPTVWLMRPAAFARGRYRLRVSTPRGLHFLTGLERVDRRTYEGRVEFMDGAPYAVFTPTVPSSLSVAGGEIEWVVTPGELRLLAPDGIAPWIERSARAVAGYFGRFPVPRVAVIVVPPGGERRGGGGSTMGYGGAAIRVGVSTRAADGTDWVLAHEMVHLGFPNLPPEQRWMEEGLATYVEPVARCRAGLLGAEEAWGGFVKSMPRGQPSEADTGLDATEGLERRQQWGRTYWGGALFWLLADVELLEKTEGRVGLDDVMAGLLREGGDIRARWEAARVLETADRVAGVPVVSGLYARLAREAGTADLDALWSRLGVVMKDSAVSFDDAAPLAWVRRRITRGARERPAAVSP